MEQLLLQLGLGITSDALYDFFKNQFLNKTNLEKSTLESDLAIFLNIQNAKIVASTIITFLAKNGDIKINGTKIYAENSISMFSSKNTKFIFGNNSSSTTKNSSIEAGTGVFIEGSGGAGIVQNEDGSISFFTSTP